MPDPDVLRLILALMLGLGATYFLVPDTDAAGAGDKARVFRPLPRDLTGEHLREAHRRPEQGCPLCDFERHGPVG